MKLTYRIGDDVHTVETDNVPDSHYKNALTVGLGQLLRKGIIKADKVEPFKPKPVKRLKPRRV